jgi:hypothetical protein
MTVSRRGKLVFCFIDFRRVFLILFQRMGPPCLALTPRNAARASLKMVNPIPRFFSRPSPTTWTLITTTTAHVVLVFPPYQFDHVSYSDSFLPCRLGIISLHTFGKPPPAVKEMWIINTWNCSNLQYASLKTGRQTTLDSTLHTSFLRHLPLIHHRQPNRSECPGTANGTIRFQPEKFSV